MENSKVDLMDKLIGKSINGDKDGHTLSIKISLDTYDIIKKYKLLKSKTVHKKLSSTSEAIEDLIEFAITDELEEKIRDKYPENEKV